MITEFHSGTFPFYASYENHRLHSPLQEKKARLFPLMPENNYFCTHYLK